MLLFQLLDNKTSTTSRQRTFQTLPPPWGCAQWGGLQPANPSEARTLLLLSSAVFWVRDIEVDERETPIGAATGVPSGSGAFAGHTLSQRSLTGCPLGPALPEVRCTPGFSRLARTSVNRVTFKSRTLSCASALCFCLPPIWKAAMLMHVRQ